MKQLIQNIKTGLTELLDVPVPAAKPGHLLIQTQFSAVSPGTERMLVDFAKSSYLEKARRQPDKVKQVIAKMKSDGILTTIESVFTQLDKPFPMGYCNAGVVIDSGGSPAFAPGDRVISNGPHAEYALIPHNLCAKVPDGVSLDQAAFTVLGSIALQGVRLVNPGIGECVAVFGLGIVGLITVQLLIANGCRVLGLDFDQRKLELAKQFGAEICNLSNTPDPATVGLSFSSNLGMDASIITAATSSDDPVHFSAQMCRKRGRIVLVGVTGLHLNRADFYEKELTFQVSCSYGPGRYDPEYEEKGHDYPAGFVRWTEQRNFEAILGLLQQKKLDFSSLITARAAFADAEARYPQFLSDKSQIGIIFEYEKEVNSPQLTVNSRTIKSSPSTVASEPLISSLPDSEPLTVNRSPLTPSISLIGTGSFATGVLLPALAKTDAVMHTACSQKGLSAGVAARKFKFVSASTDTEETLRNPESNAMVICTRHDTHAKLVIKALEAGKHVFVEKPLAITGPELDDVIAAARKLPKQILMVGFNRRFAPHVRKIRNLLSGTTGPRFMQMAVNAGAIPPAHWTQDQSIGGGRLIGEGCHFFDLLMSIAQAPITEISASQPKGSDSFSVVLQFANGSQGTINYFTNGSKSYPKEQLHVFCDNKVLFLDNFKKLTATGFPLFRKASLFKMDKGHNEEIRCFVESLKAGGPAPISFDEIVNVSRAVLAAVESIREKKAISLG